VKSSFCEFNYLSGIKKDWLHVALIHMYHIYTYPSSLATPSVSPVEQWLIDTNVAQNQLLHPPGRSCDVGKCRSEWASDLSR